MNSLSAIRTNSPMHTDSLTKEATELPVTTIVARAMNYKEALHKPKTSSSSLVDISTVRTYTTVSTQQMAVRTFKGLTAPPTSINMQDKLGRTLLHLAILNKNQLEIDRLLSLGANPHLIDSNGSTCLQLAAYTGNLEVLKKIKALGGSINSENIFGCTALYYAIKGGHLDILSVLICFGCKIESKNHLGITPLHYAIQEDKPQIVKYLLSLGANPNTKSKTGEIPLILAVRKGNTEIVESLIAKDANIEARDSEGWTPLIIALEWNHINIAEKLLAKGADPRAKTKKGATPYIIAKGCNDQESLELLEEDPYSSAFIALKKLAHIHNLRGTINLHGTKMSLECFYPGLFYVEWAKLLDKTPLEDLSYEKRIELKQAFTQAANIKASSTQILDQITAGNLTIIIVTLTHHYTALIFYKNLLFYCDRDPIDHYPISCFEISPTKITKKIINKIKQIFSDQKESSDYCTSKLPLLLSPIEGRALDHKTSERCFSIEMSLPLSIQKTKNCAFASTKGALSVALACVCGDFKQGQILYRKLSNLMKRSAYEEVIANPHLRGLPFLPRILKKINEKPDNHLRELIIPRELRFEETVKDSAENDPSINPCYSLLFREIPFIGSLCNEIERMNPLEMDLFTSLIEGFHHQKIDTQPWWMATRNLQIKLISLAVKIILRIRRAKPTQQAYNSCLREVIPLINGHPDAPISKTRMVEELENKIFRALYNLLRSKKRPLNIVA